MKLKTTTNKTTKVEVYLEIKDLEELIKRHVIVDLPQLQGMKNISFRWDANSYEELDGVNICGETFETVEE